LINGRKPNKEEGNDMHPIAILGIVVFVCLMLFVLGTLLLKHAERKLIESKKELALTLRDYAIVLRVYRDLLRRRKGI
jgi:cell division protein FtsL